MSTEYKTPNNTVNQDQQQIKQTSNKPIDTLWDGSLKVAIFENQRDNNVSYAMEPGRIYTNSEGQTREAKSFSGNEAIRLSRLLDKSYDRVAEFREQMKQQRQPRDRQR